MHAAWLLPAGPVLYLGMQWLSPIRPCPQSPCGERGGEVKVKSLGSVRLFATPWAVAYRVAISFSGRPSHPRDWTRVARIGGRRFTLWATREAGNKSGPKQRCEKPREGNKQGDAVESDWGRGCWGGQGRWSCWMGSPGWGVPLGRRRQGTGPSPALDGFPCPSLCGHKGAAETWAWQAAGPVGLEDS